MLFNSLEFAIFLPIVFAIYWLLSDSGLKKQNLFLLVVSYVFYGWWDWRFLSLIAFSSVLDFLVGRKMEQSEDGKKRKILLWISILVNLGFLGIFKYFNFFAQSFADAFTLFGREIEPTQLSIVLPVGISFYTFQTLSYSIDVYKRRLEPAKNWVAFLTFVSFFPQLVAGPIERATNLLPQFYQKRKFDYSEATDGLRQMLWGLFKKVVIADNCATFANEIFSNYQDHSGSTLLLGAIFFTFQIYGDFSGYSDIAIGVAKLFGFKLMRNFAFPYFSRDIAEFWRRWHISLSTWFREYLYIPLGGSRGGTWMKVRNTFIIFLVSGFWHGANWTFLAWGFLNACYFLPLLLLKQNRNNTDTVAQNRLFPTPKEFFQILFTFSLTVLAWIFFRSETISQAVEYISGIFSTSLFALPSGLSLKMILVILLIGVSLLVEWVHRTKQHGLEFNLQKTSKSFRWVSYYCLIIAIIWLGGEQENFIYFQF
jgi:alginate O-acetyltransferase complex protein AlgI